MPLLHMRRFEPSVAGTDRSRHDGRSPKCFMHIPKSGGVSIHSALEAALAQGSIAPRRFDRSVFCGFDDFDLLSSDVRARVAATREEIRSLGLYPAVSGHFALATLLQIADVSSIATVLREPRARLLSLFLYWRTPDIGKDWAPYRADEHALRPLFEFLSEPRVAPATDNQVCRMLLYGDPRLPQADFAASSDIEEIASDAIKQLSGLDFVGVLELRDSAWLGVAQLFDVTLDPVELNVTGEVLRPTAAHREEEVLTAEAFELLAERSAADAIVYEYALTRAGLDAHERGRVKDLAFARQLVKLGDFLGRSAAQAAEYAGAMKRLRCQPDERVIADEEAGGP